MRGINKKVLRNSIWMMSEKITSIFGLIFVTSFVAKYIGPSVFGEIAIATSLFQLIQLVSQLGTDVIIFKRISRNVISGVTLIRATVHLRVLVYILLSIPVLMYNFVYLNSGILYVFSIFVSCLFQSMDVYSIFYDATLKSRYNTFVNTGGLVFSLVVRFFIAYKKLDPLWLCLPIISSSLIPFLVRMNLFNKENPVKIISARNRSKYRSYLLKTGSNFVVTSLSVAIYTRLSLFILGVVHGKVSVGIFSVAITLASSWSFIINSVVTSSLPSIFSELNEKRALDKIVMLNRIVILLSIPVFFGTFLVGEEFINYFYGLDYKKSYDLLVILNFSTLFSCLGTISARVIAKYSGYLYLSKKMFLVALTSLLLNLLLINRFSIYGAALATVITEVLSLTVFNYFFRSGFIMKSHIYTFFKWKKNS